MTKLAFIGGIYSNYWALEATLAEQPTDDPVAALDGTGAQPWRIFGEEDRHRQQAAAAVWLGILDMDPFIFQRFFIP